MSLVHGNVTLGLLGELKIARGKIHWSVIDHYTLSLSFISIERKIKIGKTVVSGYLSLSPSQLGHFNDVVSCDVPRVIACCLD